MYSVNLLLSSWTLRTRETICRVLRSWLHLSYLLLCSWRFFFNQFCPMLVSCQSEVADYASMRHNAFRWAWWRRWGDCSNFSLPFSLISISLDRSYQCFLLPIEKALSSWFLGEQEGSKQEGAKKSSCCNNYRVAKSEKFREEYSWCSFWIYKLLCKHSVVSIPAKGFQF